MSSPELSLEEAQQKVIDFEMERTEGLGFAREVEAEYIENMGPIFVFKVSMKRTGSRPKERLFYVDPIAGEVVRETASQAEAREANDASLDNELQERMHSQEAQS